MLQRDQDRPYHLKSALEVAIERFGEDQSRNKSQNTYIQAELNHIRTLAQIEDGLAKYRSDAAGLSRRDMLHENHCSDR